MASRHTRAVCSPSQKSHREECYVFLTVQWHLESASQTKMYNKGAESTRWMSIKLQTWSTKIKRQKAQKNPCTRAAPGARPLVKQSAYGAPALLLQKHWHSAGRGPRAAAAFGLGGPLNTENNRPNAFLSGWRSPSAPESPLGRVLWRRLEHHWHRRCDAGTRAMARKAPQTSPVRHQISPFKTRKLLIQFTANNVPLRATVNPNLFS